MTEQELDIFMKDINKRKGYGVILLIVTTILLAIII